MLLSSMNAKVKNSCEMFRCLLGLGYFGLNPFLVPHFQLCEAHLKTSLGVNVNMLTWLTGSIVRLLFSTSLTFLSPLMYLIVRWTLNIYICKLNHSWTMRLKTWFFCSGFIFCLFFLTPQPPPQATLGRCVAAAWSCQVKGSCRSP